MVLSPARQHLQFACANAFLQRVFDNALFLVAKNDKLLGGWGRGCREECQEVKM